MTSFGIRIFESSTGKAQKYQDAEWALDFGTKEAVMPKRIANAFILCTGWSLNQQTTGAFYRFLSFPEELCSELQKWFVCCVCHGFYYDCQ
jgi:hypothetical protein